MNHSLNRVFGRDIWQEIFSNVNQEGKKQRLIFDGSSLLGRLLPNKSEAMQGCREA
jgi:hypothetical protein